MTDDPAVRWTTEQLARDVLTLAMVGGMPDSFWNTDSRVRRALAALGWEDRTRVEVEQDLEQ